MGQNCVQPTILTRFFFFFWVFLVFFLREEFFFSVISRVHVWKVCGLTGLTGLNSRYAWAFMHQAFPPDLLGFRKAWPWFVLGRLLTRSLPPLNQNRKKDKKLRRSLPFFVANRSKAKRWFFSPLKESDVFLKSLLLKTHERFCFPHPSFNFYILYISFHFDLLPSISGFFHRFSPENRFSHSTSYWLTK